MVGGGQGEAGEGEGVFQQGPGVEAAMLDAVTPDDMRAVTRKLVEMALAGDLKAVDLLLTRTLGKADSGPVVAVQVNQQAGGGGKGSKSGPLPSWHASRTTPSGLCSLTHRSWRRPIQMSFSQTK